MRRPGPRALVAGAVGVAALLQIGCQGPGVSRAEISEAPIAILYWEETIARERAESLEAEAEERGEEPGSPAPSSRSGTNRAVAEVDAITSYMKRLIGSTGDSREHQGRLALLHPRSGRIEVLEGVRRGALPMQWTPDHKRLLFSQVVREENPQLFEYNVETKEVRGMSRGVGAFPQGCYGPDGQMVFTSVDLSRFDQNAQVVLAARGGHLKRLSDPRLFTSFPACAPDGSAVVYVQNVSGRPGIVVHSPVDAAPRVLGPGRDPTFSHDSQWILYSAPDGLRGRELQRVRADGSGRARIGRGNLDEMRPTISPDGRHVVYVAEKNFRTQLYLRRFDGSGDRILLGTGAADRPVW